MSWYWIVLIAVASVYLYMAVGIALTSVLIESDEESSYLLDAFLGLIWPITLLLLLEIQLATKITKKEDEK